MSKTAEWIVATMDRVNDYRSVQMSSASFSQAQTRVEMIDQILSAKCTSTELKCIEMLLFAHEKKSKKSEKNRF